MTSEDVADHDLTADGDWRDDEFFRRRPSTETLSWAAAVMGRGSRIVGHRRLTGGVNSAVHRLTVEQHNTRTFVVLRQYPAGSIALQTALEHEIANLTVVAGSGLPVPTILATDVAGAATGGAPSLLMTRLPGHIHLNPTEPRPWIEQIAEFAVHLHSVDLPAPTFRPWTDSWITPRGQFRVPAGARKPAVWQAAFAAMESTPPEDDAVFLHGDYLPVNLLWSRGKITGLTDWNGIHRGSRAIDVGQCRRYLAALYSPDWAEQLRTLYRSISGVDLHPWWDLYALLHHNDNAPKSISRQVAGRRPVDGSGMTARVEIAVEQALHRLGSRRRTESPTVRAVDDQGEDSRLPGSNALAAEVAAAFGLPVPAGWADLGGSSTTNLQLDFEDHESVVARIHRRYTSPERLGAIQLARSAVCAVGVPAVECIPAPDDSPFVRLGSGRLAELEPRIRWNAWMNTVPLLEAGFAIFARVHDALRAAPIPAAGRTTSYANHIHSVEAVSATRRGAERIRGWNDVVLSRFADRVCRHIEAVDAAEAPFRDRLVLQVVHGDFWHNNVLFRDQEIAAVLDFDFMAQRPRIDDLALTVYFYLLQVENDRGLPTAADRAQVCRFIDAYNATTTQPLSAEELAALPLAIARQPAWSIGGWVNNLDEAHAREHAGDVVGELPVAQAVLAELPAWQDALLREQPPAGADQRPAPMARNASPVGT